MFPQHRFYHFQTDSTPKPPTSDTKATDLTLSTWSYSPPNYGHNQNRGYQGRLLCYSLYTVASLTDKPNQRNPKHPGVHRSNKYHKIKDTGRPAKGKPGLAMVKTGGSIYVKMPKVRNAITISDDSETNEELEQESKRQLKDKHRWWRQTRTRTRTTRIRRIIICPISAGRQWIVT